MTKRTKKANTTKQRGRVKVNKLEKTDRELSRKEQKKVRGGRIASSASSGDAATQMTNVFGYVPASVPAPPTTQSSTSQPPPTKEN